MAHENTSTGLCAHGIPGIAGFVLQSAEQGLAAGRTPLETPRNIELGGHAGWQCTERIVGNLHRGYAEQDPARPGLDMFGPLQTMVAFNGGRPLSCYA